MDGPTVGPPDVLPGGSRNGHRAGSLLADDAPAERLPSTPEVPPSRARFSLTGLPRAVWVLAAGSAIVLVLHTATVVARAAIRPESGPLVDVFALLDAGQERGLAAWWTAAMLATGALCAGGVAHLARDAGRTRGQVRAWWVVAVLFAALSFDEITSVHERGARWTAAVVDSESSLVRYGWLVPAAIALVAGVCLLVPAYRALPARPRRLILSGLALAVAGAMGMELAVVELREAGASSLLQHAAMAVEEAAEMAGVLIMLIGVASAVWVSRDGGRTTMSYAAP